MSKIYTRRGDQGQTGLADGATLPKHDRAIEVLGELDELNCLLGATAASLPAGELRDCLPRVQSQLFLLGGSVAGDLHSGRLWAERVAAWVQTFEREIDAWTTELPPLRNFILPGGQLAAAHFHWARAVARRVERSWSRWIAEAPQATRPSACAYLNRLSDWLFVAARTQNFRAGVAEPVWRLEEAAS